MTINQVQCDGCGKKEDMDISKLAYEMGLIPGGWSTYMGKDLCPDCTKKVEEFIQGLKV